MAEAQRTNEEMSTKMAELEGEVQHLNEVIELDKDHAFNDCVSHHFILACIKLGLLIIYRVCNDL